MSKAEKMPPVHPGEILLEDYLKPFGLSQNQIARDLRVPVQRINEIINGKRSITMDTALRLARYFNTSPQFWLNMQTHFDFETAKDWHQIERIEKEVKINSLVSVG